jgi:glutamate-5-semialdehyde dehydrogenase
MAPVSNSSEPSDKAEIAEVLRHLRQTAGLLYQTSSTARSQALAAMGTAVQQHQDAILEANTLDLEISREMAVPDRITDWLKLTPDRVSRAASILERLAALGETTGLFSNSYWGTSAVAHIRPLGIVALIYEAFPDLAAIAAGLCLRTGNALVLKGGNESSQTNQVLVQVLQAAIASVGLPDDSILLIPADRGDISRAMLVQQAEIDLVIPYGRPELVEQVVQQATVPVIPTRMGNCYLCWMASAELEMVHHMITDSHRGEPEAVNGIEKVVVVGEPNEISLVRLWGQLREAGFELRADPSLASAIQFPGLQTAAPEEWLQPYLKRIVAFRQAPTLSAAITWMNQHSSGHADSIATTSYTDTRQFIASIRSASMYLNTSPRFCRNSREAVAIALGMSNQAGQWGGLVGMNALMNAQRIIHRPANEP